MKDNADKLNQPASLPSGRLAPADFLSSYPNGAEDFGSGSARNEEGRWRTKIIVITATNSARSFLEVSVSPSVLILSALRLQVYPRRQWVIYSFENTPPPPNILARDCC